MTASVEAQRDNQRQSLPRQLMQMTGHMDHPYELEVIESDSTTDQHDGLVVVWCISDSCKDRSPRGTAVGPIRACLLPRCTFCHPVTWWEKLVATIKIAFG